MLRIGHGDDPPAAPPLQLGDAHGTDDFHVGWIGILILEEIVDASTDNPQLTRATSSEDDLPRPDVEISYISFRGPPFVV